MWYLFLRMALRFSIGKGKRNAWFKKNYTGIYTPIAGRLLLVRNEDEHKFWIRANWDDGVIISKKTEPAVLLVFKPKKDQIVLDIGANIGKYTILAGKKVGIHGKIIAVEPMTKTFQLLQKNIKENGLERIVTPLKVGISNKIGTARFYYKEGHSGASTMTAQVSNEYDDVNLTTIDEIVKEQNLDRLDWIKIDVEGLEYEVLSGASNSILQFRPIIIVEIREGSKEKVFDFLNNMKYNYEQLDEYIGEEHTYGAFYNFIAMPI
ncbi:MAG: FkbM family methyltransferase [Nitrososphaera sp.]